MARAWKNVKRYERWVLVVVVVILLATFSVIPSVRGCGSDGRDPDDFGGSFQPRPGGARESVSHQELVSLHRRYAGLYEQYGFGPSLAWAAELAGDRSRRDLTGSWMHLVLSRAAAEAGYRASDEEVAEAVRGVVRRAFGGREAFSVELYEQLLAHFSRRFQGWRMSRAEFETTIREILVKDKMLSDVARVQRAAIDPKAAFEEWKAGREQVDLFFAAVPGSAFRAVVEPEETTRSAIEEQAQRLRDVAGAAKEVAARTSEVGTWRAAHRDQPLPATYEALVGGRRRPGEKLPDDPWKRPYRYDPKADGAVTSDGPDGQPGTPDDVTVATQRALDTLVRLRRAGESVAAWRKAANAWPASLEDLTRATPGTPPGAPLASEVPKDAWDRALAWDGAGPTLRSLGADGAAGTGDDLVAELSADGPVVPLPPALSAHGLSGKDAWGRPLSVRLASVGATFEVRSAGPDGTAANDDDVTTGNGHELQSYFALVKREHAKPTRHEFEALWVAPVLVPDELFAKAWAEYPRFRGPAPADPAAAPSQGAAEVDAWNAFVQRVRDGSYAVRETAEETSAPIDPADPKKGYAAGFLESLREKGTIPKAATGWPVPAPETLGDWKDPPKEGEVKDLPPYDSSLWKLYVERGWRRVFLRERFFVHLLDAVLRDARKAEDAREAWQKTLQGPEPKVEHLGATLLGELRTKDILPGSADHASGARFVEAFVTSAPLERAKVEQLPVIGDSALVGQLSEKEGRSRPVPVTLRRDQQVHVALRLIKRHPEEEADLSDPAVRAAIWPAYLDVRSVARAGRALDVVRAELEKAWTKKRDAGAEDDAPVLDAAAREKALAERVRAEAEKHGFPVAFDRTGYFLPATARGAPEPVAPEGASEADKAAMRRRAYVRSSGHATVSPIGDGGTTAPGTIGRRVLLDDRRPPFTKEEPTREAYVVLVAGQRDPAPEELHGQALVRFLESKAYDTTPGRGSVPPGDRRAVVVQMLHRLYDDWDSIRADYAVKTNTDLQVPTDAGR